MGTSALTVTPVAIDLNTPGTYLHWSIFNVSVANLVLIAVMVVIFGAALLLPFPKGRVYPAEPQPADPATGEPLGPAAGRSAPSDDAGADEDAAMWTARVRRRALALLPPGKLLPDRQPAYVASWVYVFGVASLAALGVAIVSGFALAVGGPDWWHTNPVGPFLQQPSPVERRAVHGLPGHPLVGEVLDGGLAWEAGDDLDYRGGRLRGLSRRVLHGLSDAAELRLAMDFRQRQGRLQPGRPRAPSGT